MLMSKKEYAKQVERWTEEVFKELIPDITLVKVLAKVKKDETIGDIVDIIIVYDGPERPGVKKSLELEDRVWMHPDNDDEEFNATIPIFEYYNLQEAKEMKIAV